jgi:hypothetical protein
MDFSLLVDGQTRWIAVGGVLVVLALFLIWRLQKTSRPMHHTSGRVLDAVDTVTGWPPEVTRVLAHRQRRAYEVLRRAMPEHVILAQVPVSRFIHVPARLSYAEWLRRIGHVCVDLLVCDRSSHVIAVVEVRESGHRPSDRARKREKRLERVLSAAGVPLQVWDEAWMPEPATVRRTLLTDREETGTDDPGMATIPMGLVPEALEVHELDDAALSGFEPPRTTLFDDAHASDAMPLDSVSPQAAESDWPTPAAPYRVSPARPVMGR